MSTTAYAGESPRRTPVSVASSSARRSWTAARAVAATEDALREIRYSFATDRLRATGHTASDQVETVLYRLAASGVAGGIKPKREDGVVRPLLELWREETEAYCRAEGLAYRTDTSNPDTKRGLIRDQILPLLRQLHPAAAENLLRLAEQRPSKLDELLASSEGSRRIDLGQGLTAVREYERVWLEQTPVALEGRVRWGPWTIESELGGLKVRSWRPGDRLAGRSKKIQDVFVDAKIPRSQREAWPLVVRGDRRGRGSRHRRGAGCESLARRMSVTAVGQVLIDETALRQRIEELGEEISADYAGREVLLVGVLKGAVFFMADLMRQLSLPCEIDFMAISSYGEGTDSSGVVRILKDLDSNITDRHVLILEDIIDTGLTLSYLMRNLGAREPASLEVCALLVKHGRRETDVPVKYVGFEIPNQFVVGYGLDFGRALPQSPARRRFAGRIDVGGRENRPRRANYRGIMGATLALEIL